MDAMINAAKESAAGAAKAAADDATTDGSLPSGLAGFAAAAKEGLPDGLAAAAAAAGGPAAAAAASGAGASAGSGAKAKASNEYMCDGFQEMFKKNQQLYGEKMFDSLATYFTEESSKTKLTAMLEQNIGQYIRSSQFRGTTAAVIKEAIASVMRESLKKELKNPANFKGMCNEITKLAVKRRTYGGATRTKRKPRKNTVKRRN
jgi:predicted lipid-binding transport protein (Tim44 family)